mgnify:FL=1
MSEIKLKKGLVREVEEKIQKEKNQEALRKKYNIEEDIIVVEKSNTIKFLIKLFISFCKTVFVIIVTLLGTIGSLTLIYSNIRVEFLIVIERIISQALSMLGI